MGRDGNIVHREKYVEKIIIPPIYEEDIIEFIFSGSDIRIQYRFEETMVNLVFYGVYQFDFCEFEYINDMNWEFGLTQYLQSPLLKDLYSRVPPVNRDRAFGGEGYKLRHYKLAVDDVGIYNIICKEFQIERIV